MLVVPGPTEADIANTIAQAAALGGADVVLPNAPVQMVNGVAWSADNIRVHGQARTELIAPPTGAVNLLWPRGTIGTATTLTANAAQNTNQVQVLSVAGFAVGGLVYFVAPAPSNSTHWQVAEVLAINGLTIQFMPALQYPIATTDSHSVVPLNTVSAT